VTRAVALVQIDLRRGPARKPPSGDANAPEGDHAAAHRAAELAGRSPADEAVPGESLASAVAGVVLAGGLVLLAPVAVAAAGSVATLSLLLAGLAALGLFAALLRPALPGADGP
jgi:VIT1/CCC1 family predicted Fe2+/Mn2+ transporter